MLSTWTKVNGVTSTLLLSLALSIKVLLNLAPPLGRVKFWFKTVFPAESFGSIGIDEVPIILSLIFWFSFCITTVDERALGVLVPETVPDCLTSKFKSSTKPVVVVSQYISNKDSTASVSNTANWGDIESPAVVPSVTAPIALSVDILAIKGFVSNW